MASGTNSANPNGWFERDTNLPYTRLYAFDTNCRRYIHLRGPSMPKSLIRPMRRRDTLPILESAGVVVDKLYPRGGQLFEARLGEVVHGEARCLVATVQGQIGGIAVETPKGYRRYKLSTFWVAPSFRRKGIGTKLISTCIARWIRDDIAETHVTVRSGRTAQLLGLLSGVGFWHHAHEVNRYGMGRDEDVLKWSQQSYMFRLNSDNNEELIFD